MKKSGKVEICFSKNEWGVVYRQRIKYKGKEIDQVYKVDKSYCKWLSQNKMLLELHSDIAEYLRDNLTDDDVAYKINWGKHKGKSIDWIHKNDYRYFEWLCESEYVVSNCPKSSSEVERIKANP